MKAEILWAWRRLNANYWFYPALFALFALVLALVSIAADRSGYAEWLNDVAWLAPARPEGASTMLQVIAGSMIAVASTVFSITIVAVSYASGTYGPRLLTNFMEDKGNQLSLATFIGTFVFALTVLRTVRAEDEQPATAVDAAATALPGFVPQLSLLLAFVLMVLSVAVLVFFLNHVPSSIRINKVIQDIGKRLLRAIEDTYPENGDEDGPQNRPRGCPMYAKRAGYIQLMDFGEMEALARKCECEITLLVRTGDFVHKGLPILEIANGDCDDACMDELAECITQGFSRTPEQDPEFLIDELVEIGLRALSPGINDPFTAVTSLHWLGAATADLGKRYLVKDVCKDGEDTCPVHPVADDFKHFVQRGFGAIRSAVATSPIASKIMLDTLRNAALSIDGVERRELLLGEAAQLREQARLALEGPDRREVEARFDDVMKDFKRD
ncbi:DUF2254 domain-containing protein [Aurantiacibacter poecillastricola]|uniref:DUF2254 domain-containing protein n=1 Tax=Aurantiacibacter poecillastricola TaxID=3064385 RepID=UPI00273E4C9D|nr:DUF2254 domain-containing protein [Aurantiacibacter sp. 219JJ12-13]MDP5261199.1 DUF2254 domain-containing protein [Aurantiacibacter sp. 219JJ12-13]